MPKTAGIAVWAQDPYSDDIIPHSFDVFREPDWAKMKYRDIFVLSSISGLTAVAKFVRVANQHHRLRTLFIRENDNAQFLPQMLYEAKMKMSRQILVHSNKDVPKRVLMAWSLGCPDQLIATAQVIDNALFVMSCNHALFRIDFEELPALKRVPIAQRALFFISSEGSYIAWPEAEVHLDLDAIRYVKDVAWRKKKDRERLIYDSRFGEAVAALRKKYNLRQTDIAGLSERQVRRIEKGERTRVRTLEILAQSHGLSLKAYLDSIANILNRDQSATRIAL